MERRVEKDRPLAEHGDSTQDLISQLKQLIEEKVTLNFFEISKN